MVKAHAFPGYLFSVWYQFVAQYLLVMQSSAVPSRGDDISCRNYFVFEKLVFRKAALVVVDLCHFYENVYSPGLSGFPFDI